MRTKTNIGYKDIYNRIKKSIQNGSLKPGNKVTSIRNLSTELKVAKRTVEAAYDMLIGEGYLVTKGPKGTIVNPDIVIPQIKPEKTFQVQDPELVSIMKIRDENGLFRLGTPALDQFPYKIWLLISGRIIRKMDPVDLLNPPVTGYRPLREAIANYINVSRGISCSPEQIIITSGYKHSLSLILHTLAKKSDKVVFEEPGYIFGAKLLKRIVDRLFFNPVDSRGLNMDYFKKHHKDAKFVLTAPTHQSPLTVSLSLSRRQELLAWAESEKSWIIEDDYDGEFHYKKRVIPALKSIDVNDRVIYVGTFSKTIMPSIRTSYIVVPALTVSSFIENSEIFETSQPLLQQKILASFIHEGHFYKHLKRMRSLYQQRRNFVIGALQRVFPKVFKFEMTDGGMQLVAYLEKGDDDVGLAEIWQKNGLLVYPLSKWFSGKKKRYGLIIGFTNITSEEQATAAFKKVSKETYEFLEDDN
ncbi:MocR-like pyridoxine biosynthesis transcription factor PdxR [Peredibacter starrii]|uniref:PLP-dependent aminotransferase family protein n=1 Tax=Peredibacter starrii TaxID=28202 RepID=A0AAX4HK25_9BACT|nr:PLP-dependent aminotransferase family protein [Peredibacter starrii]WPU63580.1 PLP-dependent aminotransferase family protein [Peredibacter starrii]